MNEYKRNLYLKLKNMEKKLQPQSKEDENFLKKLHLKFRKTFLFVYGITGLILGIGLISSKDFFQKTFIYEKEIFSNRFIQETLGNERIFSGILFILLALPVSFYLWYLRNNDKLESLKKQEESNNFNNFQNAVGLFFEKDNVKANAIGLVLLAELRKKNLFTNQINLMTLNKDLTGANLSKADLSGMNLSKADLSEADLVEVNLSGARLSRANLTEANLTEANLSGANLTEANLTEANLTEANLTEANLLKADLSKADLTEAFLLEADLSEAKLLEADLSKVKLSGAKLIGADFSEAILSEANLSGADLSGADLSETIFSEENLNVANLLGAEFYETKLRIKEKDFTEKELDVESFFKKIDSGYFRDKNEKYIKVKIIRVNGKYHLVKDKSQENENK